MGFLDDADEGYGDEGRAGYEPKAYYRFRHAFRPCVCVFLVVLLCALFHLRLCGPWITRGQLIVIWTIVAVSFAVVVVVFIGMTVTAPKGRKGQSGSTDSTDDESRIDKRSGI